MRGVRWGEFWVWLPLSPPCSQELSCCACCFGEAGASETNLIPLLCIWVSIGCVMMGAFEGGVWEWDWLLNLVGGWYGFVSVGWCWGWGDISHLCGQEIDQLLCMLLL